MGRLWPRCRGYQQPSPSISPLTVPTRESRQVRAADKQPTSMLRRSTLCHLAHKFHSLCTVEGHAVLNPIELRIALRQCHCCCRCVNTRNLESGKGGEGEGT